MAQRGFDSEKDVRRWLEAQGWGNVWWIENASGGSLGFPDAMVADRGRVAFIELKLAWFTADGLVADVRGAQRINVRKLREAGLVAGFLGGVKGTDSIVRWGNEHMTPIGKEPSKVKMKARYLVSGWEEVGPGFEVYKGW